MPVTPLPNQPAYTRGVLNLRGTIIPVHDLRMRLSGERTEATETHVVVVTFLGTQRLGILVDAVSDILSVAPDEIKAPPQGIASVASAALVSTGGERLLNILNLPALFGDGAAGHL
jgi:purine-binding chemotaxis protein CheW